ncbi:TPA: hypothetical protein DDZ86_02700 [Candidatus Dependentiae bacterium]|nr:hypothetical protein [Candidatus Dependentiae bacterium]
MMNRFLVPFLERKPFIAHHPNFLWSIQPFILTADSAYDEHGNDKGLFDFNYQNYGLRQLDDALLASQRTTQSLIRSDWRASLSNGPYEMGGCLHGMGLAFNAFWPFCDHFGLGARTALMQIDTALELLPDMHMFENISQGPGDERELILIRERIHQAMGLVPPVYSSFSASDTEIYGKLYTVRDYEYKCQYIDAGIALGAVLPTAQRRDINNPASIPCGENGLWGLFVEGNVDATLKENWWLSVLLRFQQCLPQTALHRMPVDKEPANYGALIGPARVKPGFTLVFSPYLMFENIRAGLGLRLGYTLVRHFRDCWTDCRKDRTIPANLETLNNDSVWGIGHVHCGMFYDLAHGRRKHALMPIISLTVDIPVDWFVSERAMKTYGVSLAVESYF